MHSGFDIEAFTRHLTSLECVLLNVKCHLPWFYDQLSTLTIRKAVLKVIESLPESVRSDKKSSDTGSEDAAKIDCITDKYSKMKLSEHDKKPWRKTPQKYAVIQSSVHPDSLRNGKVTIRIYKHLSSSDNQPPEHPNAPKTQVYIANSEKIIHKMLQLVGVLQRAAANFKTVSDSQTTLDEIGFMCRQLRICNTTLLKLITQLNFRRHVARILMRLKHRGSVRTLLTRVEEEKGKKCVWKF